MNSAETVLTMVSGFIVSFIIAVVISIAIVLIFGYEAFWYAVGISIVVFIIGGKVTYNLTREPRK